jgi:hypothetical protein
MEIEVYEVEVDPDSFWNPERGLSLPEELLEEGMVERVAIEDVDDALEYLADNLNEENTNVGWHHKRMKGEEREWGKQPDLVLTDLSKSPHIVGFILRGFTEKEAESIVENLLQEGSRSRWRDNPAIEDIDIDIMDFDDVYSRVGGRGTYVWFYDPTRDYAVMREMGGIDEPSATSPFRPDDSYHSSEEIDDVPMQDVDYSHERLWRTFMKLPVYGEFKNKGDLYRKSSDSELLDDMYDGWRGYWLPDSGTLAFYKGGSYSTGGGDETPTTPVIKKILSKLVFPEATDESPEESELRLGLDPVGIDDETIDSIQVIG